MEIYENENVIQLFHVLSYPNLSNQIFTILKLYYVNCFNHLQILTFNLLNW
jgi:hypothetical protein